MPEQDNKKTTAHTHEEKRALGQRLAAARKAAMFTQEGAARELGVIKQTISSWERGLNLPDALWLRRLARLYEASLDAIVGLATTSEDALQLAKQFDALGVEERRVFGRMWPGYLEQVRAVASAHKNETGLLGSSVDFEQLTGQIGAAEPRPGYSPASQRGPARRRHQALEDAALPNGDEDDGSTQDRRPTHQKDRGGAR